MIAVAQRTECSFPYDKPVVGVAFASLAIELANALDAIGTPYFRARAIDYVAARRTFKGLLRREDFAHFEVQCEVASVPELPRTFFVRELPNISLRDGRESAVRMLGAAEALLWLAERGDSSFRIDGIACNAHGGRGAFPP